MAVDISCECGVDYCISDDFSGKPVRCDGCGVVLQVPEATEPPDALDLDRYHIERRILTASEIYAVDHEERGLVLEALRPRRLLLRIPLRIAVSLSGFLLYLAVLFFLFKAFLTDPVAIASRMELLAVGYFVLIGSSMLFGIAASSLLRVKRHIWFYDREGEVQSWICQVKRLHLPSAVYLLCDPEGHVRFVFERRFLSNLLRRHWTCSDPQGRWLFTAEEDSVWRSIVRRRFARGFFSRMTRTRMDLFPAGATERCGFFRRLYGVWDPYDLDLSEDEGRKSMGRLPSPCA